MADRYCFSKTTKKAFWIEIPKGREHEYLIDFKFQDETLTARPINLEFNAVGDTSISTMFLAADARESYPKLQLKDIKKPLLFSTIVTGGSINDGLRVFHSNYVQAMVAHRLTEAIEELVAANIRNISDRSNVQKRILRLSRRLNELLAEDLGVFVEDISRRKGYEDEFIPPTPITLPAIGFESDALKYMDLGCCDDAKESLPLPTEKATEKRLQSYRPSDVSDWVMPDENIAAILDSMDSAIIMPSNDCELFSLNGKLINAIYFDRAEDPELITFSTDAGECSWSLNGECCSVSWFADFFNINKLIGQRIRSTTFIDLESHGYKVDDDRGRQEEDTVYGYRPTTVGGDSAVFSFRNSSNGYYGGSIEASSQHTNAFNVSGLQHWIGS